MVAIVNFEAFVSGLERERRERPSPEPDDLLVVPRVDSSNRLARLLADGFERETESIPSLLVLAWEQSAGRGRLERGWSSPPGRGVYASRVVRASSMERLQRLPQLVGIGLCAGLARVSDAAVRLKWPNDLVVELGGRRRKLGGVLIEAWNGAAGEAAACIGFGVNLSHSADEMPENGISLRQLGADTVDLARLAWSLALGLEGELRFLEGDEGAAAERYRALSVHRLGEAMTCWLGESELSGTFEGFDEMGRLRLASATGERIVAAGEVVER